MNLQKPNQKLQDNITKKAQQIKNPLRFLKFKKVLNQRATRNFNALRIYPFRVIAT